MKGILQVALLCFCGAANAQITLGLKANFSYGHIGSVNLANNLTYQRTLNDKITEWSVKERWNFGFGFGGYVGYKLSPQFAVLMEPTVDHLKTGIDFIRVENKRDNNGDGDIHTETTTSDISITYFNLPILLRYYFTESRFFVQGGIGINVTGSLAIISYSTTQKDNYKNGVLDKRITDPQQTLETKLNSFSNPRFNLVIAVGKSFVIKGKSFAMDIRYNHPLTKSEMYTTDAGYNDGRFKQNNLLGIDGKTDAEKDGGPKLNDFKMSVLTLSLNFALFYKE